MIKSSHRSGHVSIERAFNCVVATILPFPGLPGADAIGVCRVGRDAVEQARRMVAHVPSDTKVF